MRYYYKTKNGKGLLNLKSPIENEDYIEITKEEFESLSNYQESSEEEKAKLEILNTITAKKNELAATDYLSHKAFEGAISEEEWLPIKEHRAALREEINQLEAQLESLD